MHPPDRYRDLPERPGSHEGIHRANEPGSAMIPPRPPDRLGQHECSEIEQTGALLFITPSIPAILKNAIDWGARNPHGRNSWSDKLAVLRWRMNHGSCSANGICATGLIKQPPAWRRAAPRWSRRSHLT